MQNLELSSDSKSDGCFAIYSREWEIHVFQKEYQIIIILAPEQFYTLSILNEHSDLPGLSRGIEAEGMGDSESICPTVIKS